MRVVIIDDDVALANALKLLLELNDYTVTTFSDAKDAVPSVEAGNYDFVLIDYKMPIHDGIWFMDNTNVPSTTRVILITAYVNRDVIKRMFALGVSGYLIKPFDEEELLRNLTFFSPDGEQKPPNDLENH
jgi:DNA-binding response OmpR family regulator